GVRLMLRRGQQADRGMRMNSLATAVTGADGSYRLSGLKAGDRYGIEVKPPFAAVDPKWHHQMPYVASLPDDASGDVTLEDVNLLKLNQSLSGVVIDPDGKPVAGATVSAQLRDGHTSLSRTDFSAPPPWTKTDDGGRFRLSMLPEAPLMLMAYISPGGGGRIRFPARVDVDLNQQDIRIVLDPSLVEEEE
ncbi:MAG TPA: carboxypeptidase-like regulatory domain-containing protein, partial [Pirellulales bacterium]|nr:carboxypeptidase-like regulatory domain-containing protein [Pirellulales bacterium]